MVKQKSCARRKVMDRQGGILDCEAKTTECDNSEKLEWQLLLGFIGIECFCHI